jgi:2'-5' RNA ligase
MKSSGATRDPDAAIQRRLRLLYDGLWASARERIRSGAVDLDPVLQAREPDRRRGLTVVARPSPALRRTLAQFLHELRRLEPDQYYYTPSEFHLTILSLFTATVEHGPFFAQKERYFDAVAGALKGVGQVRLMFRGITASPGAVMVQGFFQSGALPRLRARLRRQLTRHGLAAGIDQRYRLRSAHMTVLRFCSPLRHPGRFALALEQARRRAFGSLSIRELLLVENDWYMSRSASRTLKRYVLDGA